VFLVGMLLAWSFAASAQTKRIDSLIKEEGTAYVNLFHDLNWKLKITSNTGAVSELVTRRLDTFIIKDVKLIELHADVVFGPALTGRTIALGYAVAGSVMVMFNNDTVLKTGSYSSTGNKKLCEREVFDFANLTLNDTLQHISIRYIPHPKINIINLKLKLQQLEDAETIKEDRLVDDQNNFSLGFYYLAFGIVFMLVFLFSTDKTENLYFGLFCLCTSFTFLCEAENSYLFSVLSLFFMVFSFEFMSFFLAKVLRNKNKSRRSLVIRLILAAICFHPALLYNFTFLGQTTNTTINNTPVPLLVMLVFVVLLCISCASSVFFLIKGFRQKRWEAKTIVAVCSLALFISLLMPTVISFIPYLRHVEFFDDLSGMGIYLYPLGAVIVLGRTNRINQRMLIDQVNSIRQLSEQNLEKEREKQMLLESQNTELENKVSERTKDIIQQKEELEIKNREIEIKNKAITDNISYAQRIQSAILPDIKLIYKALEQSFIFFRPKDIVSGDFYAFAEKNDRVLIIAGDCTGHGVSGAFMSMIGSSLLNQIINEKGIYQPDQILNHLNSAVIEALKQGENESNDGMDLSICSFDLNKMELQFAGANRPMWLVRGQELSVFRPDKFPIGGLQMAKNRVFTNTTVSLQKGDTIYIFTDGYADQFGGDRGKKLMTAKFKEILLAIQHKSMREQEQHLKAHFDSWKGRYEQVDDVLVIGIRV
jgi:serine phosphatase RsbU (regulator of sigma subunit)